MEKVLEIDNVKKYLKAHQRIAEKYWFAKVEDNFRFIAADGQGKTPKRGSTERPEAALGSRDV